MYWLIIPAILLIFVAIILIRTLRFTPPVLPEVEVVPVQVDEAKLVDDMSEIGRAHV